MDDIRRVALLVDDEAAIRRLVRSALAGLDCEVVEAGDGPEAISLFKQYENRIALLVTDVVMPGMHGDELAILLKGLHPELPVLFVSAYYQQIQPSVQHFQCFAKPFHPAALARKVAEILDSGGKPTLPSGAEARSANEEPL